MTMVTDSKKKFINKIRKKTGRTTFRKEMVHSGDRVLAGLSGGKDSLALVETLAHRRKYLPVPFELEAVHVVVTTLPFRSNIDELQAFCSRIRVPLHVKEIEVDFSVKPEQTPCVACSWFRRKALFETARERNCNKVALGHHLDDAVETLLMNMIYNGTMASMPSRLSMFDGEIELIRPLIELTETEISKYTRFLEFPEEKEKCPWDDGTKRAELKELLSSISRLNKKARKSIFRAMSNIHHEYLP